MGLSKADYFAMIVELLPKGPAWTHEEGGILWAIVDTWAEELARVHARIDALIEESDPRTTYELITDWERVCGLPDCPLAGQSLAERRAAIVNKLTTVGGQSRAYFIAVAASLGYTVTIDEFYPFIAGIGRAGDAVYDVEAMYMWRVNVPDKTLFYFHAGLSTAGDRLLWWYPDECLENTIRRLAPAHTYVIFNYS